MFKVNNKSTKKKCKDLPKVNQKIQTTCQTLLWCPCCQTFVCRVAIPLIFKNVRRRKVYNKYNLRKYPRQIQHPLKCRFLPKLLTTSNCKLFSQKKHHFRCVTGSEFASDYHKSNVSYEQQKSQLYHSFLEWWLLLPGRDFTCLKSTIETLKALEHIYM